VAVTPQRPDKSRGHGVGIEALDTDHRDLVRLLNRLLEFQGQARGHSEGQQADGGPGPVEPGQVADLAALIAYLREHFRREEELMAAIRYAGLEDHCSEHAMQIAMLGLGRMGANMAPRLMKGGHDCVVYDRDPQAVARLVAEGATGASSLAELAATFNPPRAAWITTADQCVSTWSIPTTRNAPCTGSSTPWRGSSPCHS